MSEEVEEEELVASEAKWFINVLWWRDVPFIGFDVISDLGVKSSEESPCSIVASYSVVVVVVVVFDVVVAVVARWLANLCRNPKEETAECVIEGCDVRRRRWLKLPLFTLEENASANMDAATSPWWHWRWLPATQSLCNTEQSHVEPSTTMTAKHRRNEEVNHVVLRRLLMMLLLLILADQNGLLRRRRSSNLSMSVTISIMFNHTPNSVRHSLWCFCGLRHRETCDDSGRRGQRATCWRFYYRYLVPGRDRGNQVTSCNNFQKRLTKTSSS